MRFFDKAKTEISRRERCWGRGVRKSLHRGFPGAYREYSEPLEWRVFPRDGDMDDRF